MSMISSSDIPKKFGYPDYAVDKNLIDVRTAHNRFDLH